MKAKCYMFLTTLSLILSGRLFAEGEEAVAPDQSFWQTLVMIGIAFLFFYVKFQSARNFFPFHSSTVITNIRSTPTWAPPLDTGAHFPFQLISRIPHLCNAAGFLLESFGAVPEGMGNKAPQVWL